MSDRRFHTGDYEADHADADRALLALCKELVEFAPGGAALQAKQLIEDYESSRETIGWWYA